MTALTLFLTFDLIVFGSFTRLSDSGLGCPDWPGCYGHASPIGAATDIQAAQTAQPTGPVTFSKAWIEMIHRYLAMTVGALILVVTLASWAARRTLPLSPWWATATLAWVLVQGLFGALTVTWKLQPIIVTLHLLGGMLLLALLVAQHEALRARVLHWPARARRLLLAMLALLVLQIALGAWVSSNYAVLACSGFPQCNGAWWPEMDFGHGFTLGRELGRAGDGDFLPFQALVAIHMAHRLFALVAVSGTAGAGACAVASPRAASRRSGRAGADAAAGGQRAVQRGAGLAAGRRAGSYGRCGGSGRRAQLLAGARGARPVGLLESQLPMSQTLATPRAPAPTAGPSTTR